jgi:predicted ester cyclase
MRPDICPADSTDLAVRARGALERVCSGKDLDPAARYYGPTFVDHVNDMEFRGLEGTRQSVDLYKSVLSDIDVTVEEQVVDGDRVTSRFVVTGRSGNKRVRFNGITISRFEDGMIVEDWSVTDTLSLLRQIGVVKSLRLGLRTWRSVKAVR